MQRERKKKKDTWLLLIIYVAKLCRGSCGSRKSALPFNCISFFTFPVFKMKYSFVLMAEIEIHCTALLLKERKFF